MSNGTSRGALVLADGEVYVGTLFGGEAAGIQSLAGADDRLPGAGEVVFNTAMTGYHEILTDPSYAGQLVTLTYPHGGNYGCEPAWDESRQDVGTLRRRIPAQGLVLRSLYRGSLPPGRQSLQDFLAESGIPGIDGIDTRRLTLRIRDGGAANALILTLPARHAALGALQASRLQRMEELFSEEECGTIRDYFSRLPDMEGRDLVSWVVSAPLDTAALDTEPVDTAPVDTAPVDTAPVDTAPVDTAPVGGDAGLPADALSLVLLDYGSKENIRRLLTEAGARVTVLPGTAGPEEVLAVGADGVVLSNGPGDPAVLAGQVATVAGLVGKLPLLGICLGHQLVAEALEAKTYKMPFGHHGANHPVTDHKTGRVFVSSQNHGFAVDPDSLPESVDLWFTNANDGTVEGLQSDDLRIWTSQFHPEAAPGPRDCGFIIRDYVDAVRQDSRSRDSRAPVGGAG